MEVQSIDKQNFIHITRVTADFDYCKSMLSDIFFIKAKIIILKVSYIVLETRFKIKYTATIILEVLLKILLPLLDKIMLTPNTRKVLKRMKRKET